MKKRKFWVSVLAGLMALIMFATLVVSLIPVPAHAKSSYEIQNEIDALQEQQDSIRADMEALDAKQNANENETANVMEQKNAVDQQITLLHSEIANINAQITAYSQLIADKQAALDEAVREKEALDEKNKERIRAMEEEGSISYWSVLFKANSFSDFLDRLNMVQEIAASDKRRIQEMDDAAQAVAAARDSLENEKAVLEDKKISLDDTQAELDRKKQESEVLLGELVKKGDEMADLMSKYQDQKNDLIAQIGEAEKAYDEAKQEEWDAAHPPKPPEDNSDDSPSGDDDTESGPSSDAYWMVPCSYVYVSSPYGWRDAPTEGASTFHTGVDLAGDEGTPIYASRSGEVTRGGYNEYNGNFVGINHGDGFSSVYLHLSYYVVDIGDQVEQGQVIGYMGSTGIATGPHLHFTIYYNGSTVNPAEYIDI